MTLLVGCGGDANTRPDAISVVDYDCDFMPERDRPSWVDSNPMMGNYLTARGQAGKHDRGSKAQVEAAWADASSVLARQIEVDIESRFESSTQVNGAGEDAQLRQEALQVIKSVSKVKLSGVQRLKSWLDEDSCTVHVLVRMPQSQVNKIRNEKLNVALLNTMERHIEAADDGSLSIGQRRDNLDRAANILGKIDFGAIGVGNDRRFYARKIASIGDVLTQRMEAFNVLFIPIVDQSIPPSTVKAVLDRLRADRDDAQVLKHGGCNTPSACVELGRKEGGKQVVVVKLGQSLSAGSMGSWLGTLKVEVSGYDVATNRLTYAPKQAEDQVLAFDKAELDWDYAAEKIFAKNPFGDLCSAC